METAIILAFPIAVLFSLGYCVRRIFRRGMRDRVLAEAPFLSLAYHAFIPGAVPWLGGWLLADEQPISLEFAIGLSCSLYLLGAAIWSLGFCYGRFRDQRQADRLGSH